MRILKIDHLGIAVPDLEAAVAAYEALGFAVEARHDVPTEKVRTAFLPAGEVQRLSCVPPGRCRFYVSWDGNPRSRAAWK